VARLALAATALAARAVGDADLLRGGLALLTGLSCLALPRLGFAPAPSGRPFDPGPPRAGLAGRPHAVLSRRGFAVALAAAAELDPSSEAISHLLHLVAEDEADPVPVRPPAGAADPWTCGAISGRRS